MGRGLCEWRGQPRRPRTAPDRGLLGTRGCPTAPSKDAALPACLLFFSQMPSSESAAPLPPRPGLHASDPAQVPRGHSQEGGGQLPAPSTLPPRWLRGCPRHLPARSLLTQPGAPRFSPHPSDRGPRAWRVLCSCLPIRSQSVHCPQHPMVMLVPTLHPLPGHGAAETVSSAVQPEVHLAGESLCPSQAGHPNTYSSLADSC